MGGSRRGAGRVQSPGWGPGCCRQPPDHRVPPTSQTPVDEKEAQSVPNIEYLLPNIGRTAAPGDAAGEEQCPRHRSPRSWHRDAPGGLSNHSVSRPPPPTADHQPRSPWPSPGCQSGTSRHPPHRKVGTSPPGGAGRAPSPPSPLTLLSGGCSSSLCKAGSPRDPCPCPLPRASPPSPAANPETGRL